MNEGHKQSEAGKQEQRGRRWERIAHSCCVLSSDPKIVCVLCALSAHARVNRTLRTEGCWMSYQNTPLGPHGSQMLCLKYQPHPAAPFSPPPSPHTLYLPWLFHFLNKILYYFVILPCSLPSSIVFSPLDLPISLHTHKHTFTQSPLTDER